MPNTLEFGQSMPGRGNMYLQVKQKGDQVRFRIGQNPAYAGKHFLQTGDGWDIKPCPRINSQEECSLCNLYFQGMSESKKLKDSSPEESKELERSARKYSVAVTFYFPILNRDTGKFAILQTTMGVRNKLNAQYEAGIDIFKKEWILKHTGSPNPQEVYSVILVDSADATPLSPEEEEEFKKAQEYNIQQINDGNSQTDEIE